MPIYVDELKEYHQTHVSRISNYWCHMWCDAGEEAALHAMARRIGMARTWFQVRNVGSHYDLVPSKRALAIREGAVEMTYRAWLKLKIQGMRFVIVHDTTGEQLTLAEIEEL